MRVCQGQIMLELVHIPRWQIAAALIAIWLLWQVVRSPIGRIVRRLRGSSRILDIFAASAVSLHNRSKMSAWALKVAPILAKPPGSDKGMSQDTIDFYSTIDFSRIETWSIICEEMLDTQYPRVYFERAQEELRRRGISDSEIAEMRRFAWLTVGWLNFEMMVWEWVSLDEKDIRLAIDQQYSRKMISAEERDRKIEYIRKYSQEITQPGDSDS